MTVLRKMVLPMTAAVLLGLAACAGPDELNEGRVGWPAGAETLSVPLAPDTMYLFDQRDYGGNVTRVDNVTLNGPARLHTVGGRADSMTSLRWNLPPGAVVLLFENADGTGHQMAIWGRGQLNTVSRGNFNDKVSRWAWYYVGGVADAPSQLQAGLSLRPPGAQPTGAVAQGSIELYRDVELRGDLTTVGPIGSFGPGSLFKLGGASDQLSSLRWNLPPGAVVVLYEDAGGRGRQLPLWGTGEYRSINAWGLNDKASRWAWYDVSRQY